MNKQIFNRCPTLGEYHGMALPYVKSQEEYREFYKQHKEMIDMECIIYSEIVNDRKTMGNNYEIHKINYSEAKTTENN
jgi:hypothetical protein